MTYHGTTLPIKQIPAEKMVTLYEEAAAKIDTAFDLLKEAKDHLTEATGEAGYYNSIFTRNMSDYDLEREKKASLKMVKINLWRAVIEKINIMEMMCAKDAKTMADQLEKGDLPELTIENLQGFLKNLGDDLPNLLERTIHEVFEYLTPQCTWRPYKTNNREEIGNKVIKEGVISGYGGISYYKRDFLQALDNVFHLLDGRGISKHPHNLPTLLETASRENTPGEMETDYFKCKWFLNGNLHITFKRLDLVKEINKRSGECRLKREAA